MRMRSAFCKLMMAGGLAVGILGVSSSSFAQSGTQDDMRVTITLKDADMMAATKELTLKTGLNFVFEPSSEPYGKVTCQLTLMTPEEAIQYICEAAGASFRRDTNGVYIISHKKSETSPVNVDSAPSTAPIAPPVEPKHLHKFKLMHEDAKVVYDYIKGAGPRDGFDNYRAMNKFMQVVQGDHTPKGPDSKIYMMGPGNANGTGSYDPVQAQQYAPPKTFTESGNDVSLPGSDAAGQMGLGGGGGGQGFGGGGQGFGGGGGGQGFGGGGQGRGGGGGGQFGQGGASFQSGQGLVPQVPYITYDPTDNSIVVQGTDEQIKQIQDAITFFDVAPQQVVIKVEFITTTNDFTSDLGFDWTYARGQVVAGAAPGFFTNQNAPIFFNWASGNIVSRLRAELNRDTGKAVQAPVLRTLNNQPAFVGEQITTWIFFNQTISIGNGNVITQSIPEALPIQTFLSVTPRINNDGTITMFLDPTIQDISSFQTDPSGNQFPNVTGEEIGIVARVKSGETIALAGFTRKSETGADQRFPILGELPIIGQLFRHTTHTIVNSELIIFVTPTVVDEDQGGLGP